MKTQTPSARLRSMALVAPLVFAPVVLGQMEYEPDEGYHEEEWYDPSDWFDVETGAVDYEEMDDEHDYDDDWTYDDEYETTDYNFVDDWNTYYDAYYDGYYDGYYDDQFGYDYWDPEWNSAFSTGYSDGYYDGYYDAARDYEYEPYYYITMYTVDRQQRTEQQREGDETRERGDRTKGKQQAQRDRRERDVQRPQRDRRPQRTDMARRRGTIDSMSSIDPEGIRDNHHVLKLNLKEGDTVRADFGPKMTKQHLPFSEGDRVTLRGNKVQKNGQTYLVVQKIRSGDREVTLRPDQRRQQRNRYDDQRRQRDRYDDQRQQRDRYDDERQRRDRYDDDQRQRDQQQDHRRNRTIVRGTVSEITQPDINVDGRTLLRVRMEDGRSTLIAFDQDVTRDQLDIQPGDRVTIEGRTVDLRGRKVVDASSVRVNGERVRISRR